MEQNVLLTKMIGIVVAVIVAAVVLVPICNSLTEGDGGSGEEQVIGMNEDGVYYYRQVTNDTDISYAIEATSETSMDWEIIEDKFIVSVLSETVSLSEDNPTGVEFNKVILPEIVQVRYAEPTDVCAIPLFITDEGDHLGTISLIITYSKINVTPEGTPLTDGTYVIPMWWLVYEDDGKTVAIDMSNAIGEMWEWQMNDGVSAIRVLGDTVTFTFYPELTFSKKITHYIYSDSAYDVDTDMTYTKNPVISSNTQIPFTSTYSYIQESSNVFTQNRYAIINGVFDMSNLEDVTPADYVHLNETDDVTSVNYYPTASVVSYSSNVDTSARENGGYILSALNMDISWSDDARDQLTFDTFLVPVTVVQSGSSSDSSVTSTLLGVIPIFVILGIILGSVALFYQNRNGL